MPDQRSLTQTPVSSGPHRVSDHKAPGDQLLVDLLEATSHGVAVEDYIACHNAGASHAEILEAHSANALIGYAPYRALGATHAELIDTTRAPLDLYAVLEALGAPSLIEDPALVVDDRAQDHSYRTGRAHGLSHAQLLAAHRASVYIVGDDPPQLVLSSTTHPVLGGRVINVHSPLNCAGEYCCIHNPSEHHMLAWPQVWSQPPKHQMERQCPHGQLHPDPDDPATKTPAGSLHECDGCCTPPQ